jgi:hypothetical protein
MNMLVHSDGVCGTTPIYVQSGSNSSRAVIISNRNVARMTGDAVFWILMDDAIRLIGLSLADVSRAVNFGVAVPGMISVFLETKGSQVAFSTLGPVFLTDKNGTATAECGLLDQIWVFGSCLYVSLPVCLNFYLSVLFFSIYLCVLFNV